MFMERDIHVADDIISIEYILYMVKNFIKAV